MSKKRISTFTAMTAMGILLSVPAAAAQSQADYAGSTPPSVQGVVVERQGSVDVGSVADTATSIDDPGIIRPRVATAGAVVSGSGAARQSGLPVTGADIVGLVALGLGVVGTGFVLIRCSRARRA